MSKFFFFYFDIFSLKTHFCNLVLEKQEDEPKIRRKRDTLGNVPSLVSILK